MKIKRNHLIIAGSILAVLAAFVIYRVIASAKSAASRRQNVPIVRVEPPRRETVSYTLEG